MLETSTTNEVCIGKWMTAAQKALKMSRIHSFGHHNWTRIIFGKSWFLPAFEPFVVPNWPFFKALSALRGPKIAQHGLIPLVCAPPNSPKVSLEKHNFDPFLTDFWTQSSPFSRHFVTLGGPKWLAMGSKRAHRTSLCIQNGLGSFLEKHMFGPFLTHFWSQNSPFSRQFGIFRGPKQATTSSKRAKNTPGSFLKKVIFLHPVDFVDAFGHAPPWATSYSLPQPIGPRYGGLGVG